MTLPCSTCWRKNGLYGHLRGALGPPGDEREDDVHREQRDEDRDQRAAALLAAPSAASRGACRGRRRTARRAATAAAPRRVRPAGARAPAASGALGAADLGIALGHGSGRATRRAARRTPTAVRRCLRGSEDRRPRRPPCRQPSTPSRRREAGDGAEHRHPVVAARVDPAAAQAAGAAHDEAVRRWPRRRRRSAFSASTTPAMRSDSFRRSSCAPVTTVSPSAKQPSSADERQLVDRQRHLVRLDDRPDERRRRDVEVADRLAWSGPRRRPARARGRRARSRPSGGRS